MGLWGVSTVDCRGTGHPLGYWPLPSTAWLCNTNKPALTRAKHAPDLWAAHSLAVLHVADARALPLVRSTRSGSHAIPVILVRVAQSSGGKFASSSSKAS